MVIHVLNSLDELKKTIADAAAANDPIIVDFWSEGSSRPGFNLYSEMSDKEMIPENFKFYKIDVEANKDVKAEFKINSTPTYIVFKDGKLLDDWEGASGHVLEHLVGLGVYWAAYGKYGIPPY